MEGAGGIYQPGLQIDYATNDGTVAGHVTLPLAQLSVDQVRQAITAQIDLHAGIAAL